MLTDKELNDNFGIKRLPKNPDGTFKDFEAGGKQYTIIRRAESLSIERWEQYQKATLKAGFGVTVEQFYAEYEALATLIYQDKDLSNIRMDVARKLNSLKEAVLGFSKAPYSRAFYVCGLLILEEGENPTTYDLELQTKKIKVWNDEAFAAIDFLQLAATGIPDMVSLYNRIAEELQPITNLKPKAA